MLVMFAPFFIFIFGPLLQYNILVGSIVGGIYLGFCFNAGAPAVEAFIEKVSRRSNFEFGRARMFGCVGWALCASIVGIMFTINNQFVFWLGSGCALILAVLLFFAKTDAPSSATVANAVGSSPAQMADRQGARRRHSCRGNIGSLSGGRRRCHNQLQQPKRFLY